MCTEMPLSMPLPMPLPLSMPLLEELPYVSTTRIVMTPMPNEIIGLILAYMSSDKLLEIANPTNTYLQSEINGDEIAALAIYLLKDRIKQAYPKSGGGGGGGLAVLNRFSWNELSFFHNFLYQNEYDPLDDQLIKRYFAKDYSGLSRARFLFMQKMDVDANRHLLPLLDSCIAAGETNVIEFLHLNGLAQVADVCFQLYFSRTSRHRQELTFKGRQGANSGPDNRNMALLIAFIAHLASEEKMTPEKAVRLTYVLEGGMSKEGPSMDPMFTLDPEMELDQLSEKDYMLGRILKYAVTGYFDDEYRNSVYCNPAVVEMLVPNYFQASFPVYGELLILHAFESEMEASQDAHYMAALNHNITYLLQQHSRMLI
jgi:hypothetical protein